jgi:pimeloyl-ACP methyl ester carboxylesterase
MAITVFEIQFDKNARPVMPAQEQAIVQALTAPNNAIAHVIVLAHGWNNDMDEARTLYRDFLRQFEQVAAAAVASTVAIGVLWPSKRFTDAELIPGGAASADADPKAQQALVDRLQEMKHLFADGDADVKLDEMKSLVHGLTTDPAKQRRFVTLLGEITDRNQDETQRTADEGQAKISSQDGADLLKRFSMPVTAHGVVRGAGGAAAVAAAGGIGGNPALAGRQPGAMAASGIGDFFTGINAGAMRLLNIATYYTMKDRAGKLGRDGLNPLLARIQAAVRASIKFHVVGHSFGARLATAAVDGPAPLRVNTLVLLQAAYSHNGLARNFDGHGGNGFFHAVLDGHKVSGPILITHSKHDTAVGRAYPLASRLNRDQASALGDADDVFGGMGANGAQHIDADRAALVLLPAGGTYDFTSSGKRVFNLNGDATITGHSDVARPETAYALAQGMGIGMGV